jgi:hypothetical protein
MKHLAIGKYPRILRDQLRNFPALLVRVVSFTPTLFVVAK